MLGQAAGVVGRGAADALDHVNAIAAFGADGAVVLWAAEMRAALRHLRVHQPVHAPALSRMYLNDRFFQNVQPLVAHSPRQRQPGHCRPLCGSQNGSESQVEMQHGPLIIFRL